MPGPLTFGPSFHTLWESQLKYAKNTTCSPSYPIRDHCVLRRDLNQLFTLEFPSTTACRDQSLNCDKSMFSFGYHWNLVSIVGYHIPQAPTLHLSELWTEKWYQKATQTKLSSFPSWTVWSSSWIKLNERNTPRWNASFQYRTYSLCFFGQNRRRGLTPEYRWSADHSDHSATNYSELLRASLIVRCWHCHWLEFARMLPLRKWTACFPYSELEPEWVACMASFNFGFSFSVVRDKLPSKMQVSTRCTSSTFFADLTHSDFAPVRGTMINQGPWSSTKCYQLSHILTYFMIIWAVDSVSTCLNHQQLREKPYWVGRVGRVGLKPTPNGLCWKQDEFNACLNLAKRRGSYTSLRRDHHNDKEHHRVQGSHVFFARTSL